MWSRKGKKMRMERSRTTAGRLGYLFLLFLLLASLTGCNRKLADNVTRVSGDTFELGELTLTVNSSEFRDTVEPENPTGYFDYYEEYEGYRYYVMTGTVSSSSTQDVRASAFETVGVTGAGEEDGKLLFMDEESTAFLDSIGAGDERRFLLMMLVKDGAQPEKFRICYNEGYEPGDEGETYDYEVVKEVVE